jgi:beta-glucosidase
MNPTSTVSFPADFIWGASSASYQIEGAAEEDGKGLSVCDVFYRQPQNAWEGDNGDVACDHYHRWESDLDLMKQIGLHAYRFSISWPRVIPTGSGAVNKAGLDFYDRLVDGLLARGIQPMCCLFHWDFPYDLHLRGGWLNREVADWFADYAKVIAGRLGDRVSSWVTMNEPQVVIMGGHRSGVHAPGLRLPLCDQVRAAHHMLLSHGRALQALRAGCKLPVKAGAAPVGVVRFPATESPADIEAARAGTFDITEDTFWNNTWYADPMVFGHYPEDGMKFWGAHLPAGWENDLADIRQPLDFYGANIYNGQRVQALADGSCAPARGDVGPRLTSMDWKVTPESLYWGPRFFHERYKLPVLITENGMANNDWVQSDGRVRDPQRIDFTHRYLTQLARAVGDGVPVLGYMHWTWCDNFEWHFGYSRRFGLVHIDYETQARTAKDSAKWYAELIRGGCLPPLEI